MGTDYVTGNADPRRADVARYYTKPPTWTGTRWNSGSGYCLWRSVEDRPETSRQGKEDVYVAVHRLAAVAWHLPPDAPLSALDGVDVHHKSGIPWDNREDAIELLDHGRHSEITNAELRAYGEDAKRHARGGSPDRGDECIRCGTDPGVACRSDDWEGIACMECSQVLSDGGTIEVVS